MFIPHSKFLDFDQFKEAALKWDLDLRLLSSNDFSSSLCLFHYEYFQIARIHLNGKIEQKGLNPPGFRSILIPSGPSRPFSWRNKKVQNDQILFIPKDGTLDAFSFDSYETYVISIKENYLMNQISMLQYENCERYFNSEDVSLTPNATFLAEFQNKAEELFQVLINESHNDLAKSFLINELVFILLRCIELSPLISFENPHRKRDSGVKKALEYINYNIMDNFSIPFLCQYAGISQRSLEYGFKEIYQVTPKQYIKNIKLNKIKNELISSNEHGPTHIAPKYGFWHHGQFASDFKKLFGELPTHFKQRKSH